jgi:ribosomal-protein-alanine N-acetyltransferase
MVKYHVEQVTDKKFVVDNIYCNMCGKPIKKMKDMTGDPMFADYLRVDKTWGYFSNKDCRRDEFHLCEDCYDKLIKQFKIPVSKYNDYDFGNKKSDKSGVKDNE